MTVNTQAKYLLEDITFEHEGAHLAYTLGSGAASKKNTAFLFKGEELGEDGLDEESIEFLKAMKTKQGKQLPASAFAYVPDAEKPSTWKLRIDDANHVRSAVAALGKGMMGNKVEIPSKDLPAVKRKVNAAYKKFYPDNDVPEVLKGLENNESGLMLGSDENAIHGINEKGNKMSKEISPEEIEKAAELKVEALLKAKEEELLKSARVAWENEAKEEALIKSNTEIVKGLEFVSEDLVEVIVKATVTEGGESILKALEEAGKAVEVAKAATVEAKEDLEKFKEEFSTTHAINAEINEDSSFAEKKARAVEIAKANKNK